MAIEGAPVAHGARKRAAVLGASVRVRAASVWAARIDIAVVSAITLLGAVLRFWRLGTVPLGIHGDEAWTALDAQRILREGWIGVFVPSALGQPAGPLYFTALLFAFLPDTTATARFSMALFGVATIPLLYLACSLLFSRTVGAFAALILAVMMWHLHLSRTAFMVTTWPFVEMAVLCLLWPALTRKSAVLFLLTGLVHGLGIYTYNAYVLFLPVPFVAVAVALWHLPSWAERRHLLRLSAVMALATLLVAMPMISFARDQSFTYRAHQKVVNLTYQPAWKDAGLRGKADIIWARAKEWELGLVRGDRPDLGDGLATRNHPPIDPIVTLLALAGFAVTAWNWRRPQSALILAALLFLPWGALLTVNDGLFRRTLGLAPFVAMLAAFPMAMIWERAWTVRGSWRTVYIAAIYLLFAGVAFAGARTTKQYFGPVQNDPFVSYVYPYQLDAASRYMDTLPKGTYVLFYSNRWGFGYETRRFLAPDVRGEDRSREFRQGLAGDPTVPLDFTAPDGAVAYIFLGAYLPELPNAVAAYPGGTVVEQTRGSEVLFRAYVLSPGGR